MKIYAIAILVSILMVSGCVQQGSLSQNKSVGTVERTAIPSDTNQSSIFVQDCKSDAECFRNSLVTCKRSAVTISDIAITTKKEIIGQANSKCDFIATVIEGKTPFGDFTDATRKCSVPLRNDKFYLHGYEVEKYCEQSGSLTVLAGERIAENPKECPSLKGLKLQKKSYGQEEYRVEIKTSSTSYPMLSGYEVKSQLGVGTNNYDYVYCYKGKYQGENVNSLYCGDFKLTKTVTAENGTIEGEFEIFAKIEYDANISYIQTICTKDSLSFTNIFVSND